MSGGVDSAVAALLLKQEGHDVTGANMRFWEYKSPDSCETDLTKKRSSSCCSPEDLYDAEKVARVIGIPFYSLKMESNFREKVINPFIADYAEGRTPNPCVNCNTFLKFHEFYQKAMALGFEKIATGHYAKITRHRDKYAITPAQDQDKDQAYYLYGLQQDALRDTVFPLADLTKKEVREIAAKNKLPVSQKPESQEICFIPENNYREFLLKEGLKFQSGFIKDMEGRIIARHTGKENFTIGQRKGLGIATGQPMYVIEIHDNGDVMIGEKKYLNKTEFTVTDLNFQAEQNIAESDSFECLVQVRYNARLVRSSVRIIESKAHVNLIEQTGAITPGQAAVFYDSKTRLLLFGGKISPLSSINFQSAYKEA